jgi:hypothetical protein
MGCSGSLIVFVSYKQNMQTDTDRDRIPTATHNFFLQGNNTIYIVANSRVSLGNIKESEKLYGLSYLFQQSWPLCSAIYVFNL